MLGTSQNLCEGTKTFDKKITPSIKRRQTNLSHCDLRVIIPKHLTRSQTFNMKEFKPLSQSALLAKNPELSPILEKNTRKFEEMIAERLEKLHQGKGPWSSEIEVIDSVYAELISSCGQHESILKILRIKLEESLKNKINEAFTKRLAKLEADKTHLLAKVQGMLELNGGLEIQISELREKLNDYERLFGEDQNNLVRYGNIVDEMIRQCNEIKDLKRENKRLRQDLVVSKMTIADMKIKSMKQKKDIDSDSFED
jgi:hypothetical protein